MQKVETWDMVNLPIYWKWLVIETYGTKAMINFENKLFWLRRIWFELIYKDYVTKPKKDMKPDYKEDYYNDIHREDLLLTNDMI